MNNNVHLADLARKVKAIYDNLFDEQSRNLFSQRLLFNLTSDWRFVKEMISYVPELRTLKIHPYVELLMNCQQFRLEKRKLIIYGAGYWSRYLCEYFPEINWFAFCDKDVVKQNRSHCGLPVISPDELKQNHMDDIIVVGSIDHRDDIYQDLLLMGFKTDQILTLNSEDPYSITNFMEEKQYFESDLFGPTQNEVFVDAGCFDCGSSLMFRKWCGDSYEKIYAFEPDRTNFVHCQEVIQRESLRDVEIFNAGVWSQNDILHFKEQGDAGSTIDDKGTQSIVVKSLDDVLQGQRITFIKMDVEGAELEALKGATQIITSQRPRLAICIYHKPEDILEIPLFLQSLIPDYRFYIRHYSDYSIETVLYAV